MKYHHYHLHYLDYDFEYGNIFKIFHYYIPLCTLTSQVASVLIMLINYYQQYNEINNNFSCFGLYSLCLPFSVGILLPLISFYVKIHKDNITQNHDNTTNTTNSNTNSTICNIFYTIVKSVVPFGLLSVGIPPICTQLVELCWNICSDMSNLCKLCNICNIRDYFDTYCNLEWLKSSVLRISTQDVINTTTRVIHMTLYLYSAMIVLYIIPPLIVFLPSLLLILCNCVVLCVCIAITTYISTMICIPKITNMLRYTVLRVCQSTVLVDARTGRTDRIGRAE